MKFKGILAIATLLIFLGCSKKNNSEPEPEPEVVEKKHKISGIVSGPSGEPLEGVIVSFKDGTNNREVTTNASGEYLFEEFGSRPVDLYFDGNPLRYLNMRDIDVEFGEFDRTFNKMIVPWQIEEMAYLNAQFVDSTEKVFSLIHHNFDELKMQPSDFKNMVNYSQINDYETTLTSVQSDEEADITVSVYSIPEDSGYTIDTYNTITYADVLGWEKILTVETTTTPLDVREPVVVNLAVAYANFPDYNHSGTILMVSEDFNATLGVTSPVDILEIRLPYGDDFIPQD